MPKRESRKTFWEFFINNRKFILILSLAILVIGIFAIYDMPKESTPEIDIPIVVVSTPYVGASPEEVEKLVTNVIEDELLGLSDVKEISSWSYQGLSSILIEFDIGVDKDDKKKEVESAVDRAEQSLPGDAESPRVEEVFISGVYPILRFSLSGPYDVNRIKNIAEDLEERITRVPNVRSVDIAGGEEREVRVLVDKASLDNYNLNISQITDAIRLANSDIPIGSIEIEGLDYSINLEGRIVSAREIKNIPITSSNGSLVYIRDVARVKDTFKDRTSISRVGSPYEEPQSAVSLSVVKGGEGNILRIIRNVQNEIEEAKGDIIPENIKLSIIDNQADNIRNDIWGLTKSGIQTVAVILFLLMVFVGWREAILSALAVPLTFLVTFIGLYYIGYSLNFLTLFALILSLGILVDSIIVVTEGINRKIRQGYDAKPAAIATVREYNLPLIAGTLTTVFVFLPMLLTSGIVGEFIKPLPVTVTITLLAALFVTLGLLTSLSIKWLQRSKEKGISKKESYSCTFLDKKLLPRYISILNFFLNSKRSRRLLTIILILSFLGSVMLPVQGILKQDLFPDQDQDYFAINIKNPAGTSLEKTSETLRPIEEMFRGDERVDSFQSNVGSSFTTFVSADTGGGNRANIIVNLARDREDKSFVIAEEYRQRIGEMDIFPAEAQIVHLSAGPPSTAAITANITGPSLDGLYSLGQRIKEELEEIPGSTNVEISKEETPGEFAISIDRDKAQLYGVNTQQLAGILRDAISGTEATVIRGDGEDSEVIVKYDLNSGDSGSDLSINDLSSLSVVTARGSVPLASFISTELKTGRGPIEHQDGERIVKVTGDSVTGVSSVEVTNQLMERIEVMDIPPEYEVFFGGELQEIDQSFNDLYLALFLGIFVIAMIMVLQFKSLRQPLFVLISVPLSIIGIFPALVLIGQPLSFPGFIGIVALAGIVVNNAILLIDAINKRRIDGLDRKEAILESARIRFQPIILTATTTIFGMIPLAFSNPTWAPIAYSIIFGLFFSTVLTLLVVPLIYNSWGESKLDLLEN